MNSTQIEKIIGSLADPKMADRIINELNSIQELPKTGIVAGQAVSSVITEILGIELNCVINDIDIFLPFTYDFKMDSKVSDFFKNRNFSNEMSSIRDIQVTNNYGHLSINSRTKYSIVGTTRFNKINKVFINTESIYDSMYNRYFLGKDIVESFDINSTQVGIDLSSKRLFYSHDFLLFLTTRQLEIINFNTPVHSIIRLVKKNLELGSFCDLEENQNLTSIVSGSYLDMANLYNFISEATSIEVGASSDYSFEVNGIKAENWISNHRHNLQSTSIFFGEKHKETYLEHKSHLEDLLLLSRVNPGEVSSEHEVSWISDIDASLSTLVHKDKVSNIDSFFRNLSNTNFSKNGQSQVVGQYTEDLELLLYDLRSREKEFYNEKSASGFFNRMHSNNAHSVVYALPKVYKSFKKIRNKTIHFINDSIHKSDKYKGGYKYTKNFIDWLVTYNQAKLIGMEAYNYIQEGDLIKFARRLKNHSEIDYLIDIIEPKDIPRINTVFDNLEEEFGEMIYGVLSRKYFNKEFLQEEVLRVFIESAIKLENEDLKEREIDYKEGNAFVKELIRGTELREEGDYMGHCVGGYSVSIKNGSCLIFSMQNESYKRMTMEIAPAVTPSGESYYQIIQIKGKRNIGITYEESKSLLTEINKTYKILPLEKDRNYVFAEVINEDPNHERNAPRNGLPEYNELDINADEIPF